MSKERARRRAERLAVLEREKASRARRTSRRQRARTLVRRLRPRRRGTGRLRRYSRAQRLGIALIPLLVAVAVWFLVPDPALRLVLVLIIALALPPLVVVALGRRS